MTVQGLDMAWDRPTPAEIVAAGYRFVCRYVGEDRTGKDITRAEAEALSRAGLSIVTNYEYAPGGALRGFEEGRRVAKLADAEHQAAGGPADRPIYFSVDVDIRTGAQLAAVAEYFRGIGRELGIERVGVYGEFEVVQYLAALGRARWFWQTYAWSGGRWYAGTHIRQVRNGINVAGHDVDADVADVADFGQWSIGGSMLTKDDISALLDAEVYTSKASDGSVIRVHTVREILGDVHAVVMGGHTLYGPLGDSWLARTTDAAARDSAAAAAAAEQPVDVERLAGDFVAAVFSHVTAGVRVDITPRPLPPAAPPA